MSQTRLRRRSDLFDRGRRTLARGADRYRRAPADPGALLDASGAARSRVADSIPQRPDDRHVRAPLSGAAERDRLVGGRSAGGRGHHAARTGTGLPGRDTAGRPETGARRLMNQIFARGATLLLIGLLLAGGVVILTARSHAERAHAIPAPVTDETPSSATTQVVVLAGGCFWGVQAVFQHVDGVTGAESG